MKYLSDTDFPCNLIPNSNEKVSLMSSPRGDPWTFRMRVRCFNHFTTDALLKLTCAFLCHPLLFPVWQLAGHSFLLAAATHTGRKEERQFLMCVWQQQDDLNAKPAVGQGEESGWKGGVRLGKRKLRIDVWSDSFPHLIYFLASPPRHATNTHFVRVGRACRVGSARKKIREGNCDLTKHQ